MDQETVREKLRTKTLAMRRNNIAQATGIPKEMISRFASGKRDLWRESLVVLDDYLDRY